MASGQCSRMSEGEGEGEEQARHFTLDDFIIGKELGIGKIGRTYAAKMKSTGQVCALKVMLKETIVRQDLEAMLIQEMQIRLQWSHGNILDLADTFEDAKRGFMIYEYASRGNVQMLMLTQLNRRFDNVQTAQYVSQVANALHFCHNIGVIHRDIRPANLLVSYNGDIKIGEFGLAYLNAQNEARCPHKEYFAPEMIESETYDINVDAWALGVLCYNLLVGDVPFKGNTEEELVNQILSVNYTFPSYVYRTAQNLIKRLLVLCPSRRLSLLDLLNHTFIKGATRHLNVKKIKEKEPDYESLFQTPVEIITDEGEGERVPYQPCGPRTRPWNLRDFQIGYTLGRGLLGCLYVAKEKSTKLMCVIKVMAKKDIVKYGRKKSLKRQIKVLSKLRHPRILNMFTFFHDKERIFLVLEYAAHGNLETIMSEQPNGHFDDLVGAKIVMHVTEALMFLHNHGVMHRDIRLKNLLLDHAQNIKLADFGASIHTPSELRTTGCGDPQIRAPEMIEREEYDDRVDNWSLGVLAYTVLIGKVPFDFDVEDLEAATEKLLNVDLDFPNDISTVGKAFIMALIQREPEDRMSLEQVVNHPWIVGGPRRPAQNN